VNARQRRRKELITWVRDQYGEIDAGQLADALSCEALPNDQVPPRFQKTVTEFRHLRTDARVAACHTYLERCRS
jgi:hypothetical protein